MMRCSPGRAMRPRNGITGPQRRREMTVQTETAPIGTETAPTFGEAFWLWLKIGCINFGGPAGQIAMMHRMLVDEKKWIDEPRFLHALNFCMVSPGPEAQKLATYIGWLLHGIRGGLAAGILFVLPGAVVMLGLSLLYALGRGFSVVDGALFGIKAAVLVIVLEALLRIGKRAQQAVETHGWMTAPEMVDGLGLAETTPGPLILVTQFVGFLAAFRDPAPFPPVAAGILGAAMTTWVTFVPSMLWIFAGAPFVEQLRANRRLSGALAAITAAVVGVILNLSVWFALHVLFGQVEERHTGWLRWYAFDPLALDLRATALALIAGLLAFWLHRGLIEVVAGMAALGIALRMLV